MSPRLLTRSEAAAYLGRSVRTFDAEVAADTANVLLKYRTDIVKVVKEFADNADELAEGAA